MEKFIAITSGDPSGIGPEITVKALKAIPLKERKRIVVLGNYEVLKKFGWNSNLSLFIPVTVEGFKFKKGINPLSGKLSFKILELAVKLSLKGFINGIVTAPISKKAWKMAGLKYNGHTEYFRSIFKKEPLMAFHKGRINTALITEHVSIKDLPQSITYENIVKKVFLFKKILNCVFKQKKPKIAITGLNPHCGENGEIGYEEERIIKPALKMLKRKNILVEGPFNSDSILNIALRLKIFNFIFMYHDQLLIALKYFQPEIPVVHATWNLPFIRTSPAHGTAFDIAEKNKADSSSMAEAIRMALKWSENNNQR